MLTRKFILISGGVLAAILLFAAAIVAVGALTWSVDSNSASAQGEEVSSDRRTVDVAGQGQVSMRPDTGLASVGVEVRNENLDTALSEANEQIDAITAAVQELGVAEEDIQTANFSIWPEYDQGEGQARELIGYNVSHILDVKVTDIEATGDVVSAAVDAGANVVNNVSFIVDNPGDAVSQAREQAVADARAKAEELASLADASLGPVVHISESSQTPGPRPIENAEDEAASGSVGFQPGQSIVSVSVIVIWELQ